MATCVNDADIPDYMQKQLADLKDKQKKAHKNLTNDDLTDDDSDDEKLDEEGAGADVLIMGGNGGEENNSNEEEEGDGDSEDDEPPAKRARMSRMSVDAQIAQIGMNPLFGLDTGRMSRSMSHLSRSSRASSVASSVASSAVNFSGTVSTS